MDTPLPAAVEFTYQPAGRPIRLRLGRPIELNSRLEFYLLEEVS